MVSTCKRNVIRKNCQFSQICCESYGKIANINYDQSHNDINTLKKFKKQAQNK